MLNGDGPPVNDFDLEALCLNGLDFKCVCHNVSFEISTLLKNCGMSRAILQYQEIRCKNATLHLAAGLRRGERRGRRFYAENGLVYDADINAACNIARRSKLPFSRGNLLSGQAVVNQPNVCKSSHPTDGASHKPHPLGCR